MDNPSTWQAPTLLPLDRCCNAHGKLRLWLANMFMDETNFPVPVKSALVVFTALPMAHLFTGNLMEGGFFHDFQVGIPLIVKMKMTYMHLLSEWKIL
jgi:hypothetical protein